MGIDEMAADWAVRIDNAPLDPAEQAALEAWLADDVRRLGAYARARATMLHSRRIRALGRDLEPNAIIDDHHAEAPVNRRPTRRRALVIGSSAAAAATAAMLGFSWQAAAHTYKTGRGEIRLIPLDDGSSMTLNTASAARVDYGGSARRVELIEGEALFDVIRDAARPFLVMAGETDIRAEGTSFSVRRLANRPVEIVVRHGEVAVSRRSAGAPPERLSANMRATAPVAAPMVTTTLPPAEVGRALAWRNGMLSFEDMPLAQAAEEFARYSDVRIRFADPKIASETVTGLFAANDPAGFARTVAISLDLRAEPAGNFIVLHR